MPRVEKVPSREWNRRDFLRGGFATLAAFLGIPLLPGCDRGGPGGGGSPGGGGGSLGPPDANGVRLLPGFTSRIVARSGIAPVAGGPSWHSAPDGGACFPTAGGGWIYVSNSEIGGGGGGVRALRFDAAGNIVGCGIICSGTNLNCAGGKMPWGSWLTCEENGDTGRVLECDPLGVAAAADRPALGRFNHEAAAWDEVQERIYLTEDRADGGLYRFTPDNFISPGVPDLSAGTLEVAQVSGGGLEGSVTWLEVPDPDGSPTPTRNQVAAMTEFNGGEGVVARNGVVHFVTKGDNRVWSYDVATQMLEIIYDDNTSPTPILTGVDNIEISADGDLFVAEDGGDMQIVTISPDGTVLPLLQLVGHPFSEITGPAFDPGGGRLYFSSQRGTTGDSSDGVTFEITGPFV